MTPAVDEWVPHTVVDEVFVDPAPVRSLQQLFDNSTTRIEAGDPLPPLWHWVAIPTWPASGVIGGDGHPSRGGFLPPVDLPRRMFAGGKVEFHTPIEVGSVLRRETEVTSVADKTGRSGKLVIVTTETRLVGSNDVLALTERQDLVYREVTSATASAIGGRERATRVETATSALPVGTPLSRTGEWAWGFRTDPTLLMRFSAATANPHRIHYDWPYATEVEGYPALVVHGPLMTLAAAETIRCEEPSAGIGAIAHKVSAPLFVGQDATIDGDLSLAQTIGLALSGLDGTTRVSLRATRANALDGGNA